MLYVKTELSKGITLTVPIFDDEIYATCPKCGSEHVVDTETIAQIINNGGDLYGTDVYCKECSGQAAGASVS